jgi:hypothetical protein
MAAQTEQETLLRVTLKAEGEGPPVALRWRRFLKAALRSYGLRCTRLEFLDLPTERQPAADALASRE